MLDFSPNKCIEVWPLETPYIVVIIVESLTQLNGGRKTEKPDVIYVICR